MKPKLLMMGNVPKPLHGVNPRNLMGYAEWLKLTHELKESNPPVCEACDTHTPKGLLDVHEHYNINYHTGRVEVIDFVLLCKKCHNFIHSGLLRIKLRKGLITEHEVRAILQHGFDILEEHGLFVFLPTAKLAEDLGMLIPVPPWTPEPSANWEDWYLVWNGLRYYSPFKNLRDWSDFYENHGGWRPPRRVEPD